MRKRILSLIVSAIVMLSALYPGAAVSAEPGVTVINVVDYGADPTGVKDSAGPVQLAVAAAKEANADGPVTIYFPKGEYHFWEEYAFKRQLYISNTNTDIGEPGKTKKIGILIEDMRDVTVDGGGSLLIFHGNMMILSSIRSKNVTFKNFEEDWYSPSIVDITVEEKGDDYTIIYVPECYDYAISGTTINWRSDRSPVTGQPYFSGSNMMNAQYYDARWGTTSRGGPNPFSGLSKVEDLGNNRIKLTYSSGNGPSEVGYVHEMRYTTSRPTSGMFFTESENTVLRDAKVSYLHGFGIVGQFTDTVTIDNVNFTPRPGTGRVSTSSADFIQMSGAKGQLTFTNCNFSNPQDDVFNIHAYYMHITAIAENADGTATYTVKTGHAESHGFQKYYPGDLVEFASIATGQPVGTATVQSVEGPLASSIDTMKLTFDKPIPGVAASGYLVENLTYIPDVRIAGNRMANVPTRGILCSTRGRVVIENNYFDRMNMASILVVGETYSSYRESGKVADMTIRGNVFDRPGAAAISFETNIQTSLASQGTYFHNNIVIEDNIFNMNGNHVVYARDVGNLTFRNNTVNRYYPNVSLAVTAPKTALAPGESASLAAAASGSQLSAALFNFDNRCGDVTISGNKYDDGLNLYAQNIAADKIAISGDDVTRTANQKPGAGAIYWVSSAPDVASVDQDGKVTAAAPGVAEIYACLVSDTRSYRSNTLTFTVTDDPATGQPGRKAPESVVIDAPSYCIETPVSAVQFSADVQPPEAEQGLVWSVRDAASKQQTAKAAVSPSGVLTAVEPAVVEVLAHAAEDASVYDARLVTIRSAADKLSPLWSIESPNAAKYAISGEAATIVSNGGNMYNTGSSMPNIFFAGIPWGAASAGDFSAQVRVSGKPNAGYQEAGLIFYKDQNNYVSALRKNQGGSPRVGAISEANASASEGQYTNDSGFGLGDVMYLRITKTGAVYKSEYSTDGTVWNVMGATGEYTNAALGSDFKIGFYAGNTAGPAITFDDFRVNGAPLPLTSQHNPPSAVGPAIAASGGTLVLSSGYASPDATPEGASVCRWYASGSPDGPFKPVELSDKTIAVAEAIAGQYVKAAIVPIDMDGRTGAPVWTDAVQAPAAGAPNNAGLASLTAANAAFDKPFSPGVTSYAAYAAPGFALTAKAASPGATVTILSGETALASGVGQASAAISPDAGPITVRVDAADGQTSKDYGISVRPLADSDAYLKSLVPDGVSPIAFSPDTQWYTAAASTQNAIQLSLATRSAGAGVKIYVNDELFDSGDSAYSGEIPLFSGLNAIKAVVTAADGMTERFYRLSVLKADNSAWQVRDISIDGETIDGFDPDVRSYELWLARGQNPVLIGATPADPSSSVNISVNGAVTSGLSVNARLEAGWNNATIAIAAANSAKTRTYELKIFLPSDANADITSIDIAGVKLVPAFSPEITSYTAYTGGAEQGFAVTALESGARLKAVINNQTVGGNGQIAGAANLYPGSNVLTVRSVSPDGSATRVYTVDIIRSGFVYVSDLDWESATLGDTNGGKNPAPAKDRGWEGAHRPVNLIGADMTAAEYAKGISTHAASDIVYDVAGKGYAKFVSDYGIEFDVTKKNEPNVRFYVLIDGVVTFTSDVMNYAPYQHVEVDIPPSAQKVTLRVLGVNNIWSAHATWADAKFYFETSQGGTDVSHAITVAPAANGSVAANPQGSVPRNGDAVFSFVPDPGYALKSVTINGDAVSPAPDGTYTVAKVQCDLAVTAVFAPEIDAEIALDRDGGTVAADYTLINLSAGGVEAVCVLAVYDGGRLVDLKTAPAAAGKGAEAQASLQTTAAPGCSVRAYVWRADTYAPICDAATL